MDLSSVNASPVLADPLLPMNQTRLGFHSSVFPLLIPKKKPGKVDDVRSNGWLDAMRSSSPPCKRMVKDVEDELASDENDLIYYSWKVYTKFLVRKLVINYYILVEMPKPNECT